MKTGGGSLSNGSVAKSTHMMSYNQLLLTVQGIQCPLPTSTGSALMLPILVGKNTDTHIK